MYCSEGSHSGTLMYGSEGSHSGTLMYCSEVSHSGTLMYGSEGSQLAAMRRSDYNGSIMLAPICLCHCWWTGFVFHVQRDSDRRSQLAAMRCLTYLTLLPIYCEDTVITGRRQIHRPSYSLTRLNLRTTCRNTNTALSFIKAFRLKEDGR